MQLLNRFLKLKTWQKLGIGIALLTIFKYLTMNGFIINVQAQENNVPGIIIVDNDTGLPIEQTIPCNNKICSNFDYDFSTLPTYTNYMFWYQGTSSITNSGNYHSDFKGNSSSMSVNISDSNIYYYRFLKSSSTGGITGIERNSHYSIVFSIYIDNLNYGSTILNGSDISFKLTACTNDSCGADMVQHITNVEKSFIPPESINDNIHYAFFKIDFDTLATFPTNTRIDTIEIGTKNRVVTSGSIPNNYFFNHSTGSSSIEVKQIVMVQDATTAFIPTTDYDSYFGLKSGEPLNDNSIYVDCSQYNVLTEFNEYTTCQLGNVKNGVQHFLDNLLFNLVNLFKYVFVPDFDFIQTKVDSLENTFYNKYPDIDALFDYFQYFQERLTHLERQSTISFPGVKAPGYDTYLISSFTFDFDTILTDPTFSTYYVIVRMVISATLILAAALFEYRFIKSIIHDLPLDRS